MDHDAQRLANQRNRAWDEVVLHDVAAANYRAAGDLLRSCPAENRLTPPGHLDAERAKMRALRNGINAIQPVLAHFEDTLNADQKKSFDTLAP